MNTTIEIKKTNNINSEPGKKRKPYWESELNVGVVNPNIIFLIGESYVLRKPKKISELKEERNPHLKSEPKQGKNPFKISEPKILRQPNDVSEPRKGRKPYLKSEP